MQNKRIIDAHMHLWNIDAHHYPWLVGNKLGANYLLNDYLHESARYQFDKAVHIQAGIDRPDSVLETAWIERVSAEARFPLAIVGYVDLSKPDCERVLNEHLAYPHFVGVRQILCDEIDYLSMPEWKNNIKLMDKHGLVFDAQIRPEQTDALSEVISTSQAVYVIEHLGLPKQNDADYFVFWQNQMKKLAQFDHVYMKLSGVENNAIYYDAAINIFGVDRCMFGSNFPVDKPSQTLDQMYDGYIELCALMGLSEAEQDALFFKSAEQVYF